MTGVLCSHKAFNYLRRFAAFFAFFAGLFAFFTFFAGFFAAAFFLFFM